MKKLFSLFMPLMVMLFVYSPQQAWADTPDYFTVTNTHASQQLTVTLKRGSNPPTNVTLHYRVISANGTAGAWQTVTTTNYDTGGKDLGEIPAGARMQLYGSNPSGFGQSTMNYWKFYFGTTGNAVLSGELMSIFSGTETSIDLTPQLPNYAFYGLFYENSAHNPTIISAKDLKLSATNLGQYCYRNMFYECSNMTDAPQLSATTLAAYCYQNMFSYCSSLTTAPTLPATTLADYCYYSMFSYCTSLTTAPLLPVTTLTEGCYDAMFKGCTALVNVQPELPGTNLPKNCYYELFSGCTALTTAPEIMAGENATVGQAACCNMFTNCSTLTKAPSVLRPRTLSVNAVYKNMFLNCTSLQRGPDVWATTIKSGGEGLYGLYQHASNVSHIRVHFTAWGASSFCNQWTASLPKSGDFYCPPQLERDFTNSSWNHIPYSPDYKWTVYSYDMTFVPLGDNWPGESNNNNKHFTWETDVNNVSDFLDVQAASPKMKGYYLDPECTEPVTEEQIRAWLLEQDMYLTGTKTIYVKLAPHLIQFINTDETVLQSSYFCDGDMPVYSGAFPQSPSGPGYFFTGWTPSLVAVTGNKTYTATYEVANDVTITVSNTNHGTLTVTTSDNTTLNVGANTVKQGTVLQIDLSVDEGYRLLGWTDIVPDENGQFRVMTADPQTIGVNIVLREEAEIDCTSEFGTVTIEDEDAGISVINRGTFDKGFSLTLTPTPAFPQLEFKRWSDNNTDNPRTYTLTGNTVLQAIFGPKVPVVSSPVSRTVTPQGIGAGTSIVYKMEPCTVTVSNTTYIYNPVDMGYGVAWADRNLGSTTETGTGTYYGWGDVTGKARTGSNYDFYENIAGLEDYGTLPSEADAAQQTLRSSWKIPSKDQMQALVDNTTSSYTNSSPAYYTLTSISNGHEVKLPVTGYGKSSSASSSYSWHWTNELAETVQATPENTHPWVLKISGTGSPTIAFNNNTIYAKYGIPIRPIYDPDFDKIRLTVNVGSIQYIYVCEAGQQVTLTADGSAANYRFVRWKKGDDVLSTNATYTFMEFADATYTAEFTFDASADVYQGASANVKQIKYPLAADVADGIVYTPIDLGYGVAWANKNVGAKYETANGSYFAWGQTNAKTSFSTSSYHNTYANPPAVDEDLGSTYDAATQNIDSLWRMPKKSEWEDLKNTDNVNFNSYTFTNKQDNTKSIFLPNASIYNTSFNSSGGRYYWSSTLATKGTSSYKYRGQPYVYYNGSVTSGSSYYAYFGMPVRAIYDPGTTYVLTIKVGDIKHEYICVPNQTVTVTAHPSEGYEFDEWEEGGNMSATRTFTVTEDATYTAKFKSAQVSSYALLWDANGGALSGEYTAAGNYAAGADITAPTATLTGYTHTGWSPAFNGKMPDAATTYVAQWTATTYNLTYNGLEGASNSNPATYTIETATINLANPGTRAGYSFTGWTCGGNPITQITLGSTGDKTITANWSANTNTAYTVKHYQQNLALDGYTEVVGDRQTPTGTTAGTTAAEANTYTGFTAQPFEQGTIAADGSTVVSIYYNRDKYTVTVAKNENAYGTLSGESENIVTVTNVPYGTVITTGSGDNANKVTINGTQVTATKHADDAQYTYAFTGWTNGTETVTGALTVTANFTRTTKQYTLNVSAGANGTVTGGGTYDYDTDHNITATADEGYHFVQWQDGNTANPRTINVTDITAATTYTATFAANTNTAYTVKHYQQNLALDGYTEVVGDMQNLTGTTAGTTAAEAKSYTGFTAQSFEQGTIAADGSTVVSIYYNRDKYTVTVAKNENAYGTLSEESENIVTVTNVPYGTVITTGSGDNANKVTINGTTVTATKNANDAQYTYTFTGWTNGTETVTGALTVTANFTRTTKQYTLDVEAGDNGSVSGGGTYNYGASAELTATPAEGYHFVSWSDGGAQTHSVIVTDITAAQTYTATFAPNATYYKLTISAGENGTVDTSVNGSKEEGTNVQISATANTFYQFDQWSDGNEDNPRTVTMNEDKTLTASFKTADVIVLEDFHEANAAWWSAYSNLVTALGGTTVTVQYNRTLTAGQWNVVSLPFEFNLITNKKHPFNGNIYEMTGATYNDGYLDFNFMPMTTVMKANKPYIFYSGTTVENVVFENVEIKPLAEYDDSEDNVKVTVNVTGGTIKFRNTTYRENIYDSGEKERKRRVFINGTNLRYPNNPNIWIRAFRGYFYLDIGEEYITYIQPRLHIINGGQVTTLLEGAEQDNGTEVKKYIERGILVIERNGIKYNAQGARME